MKLYVDGLLEKGLSNVGIAAGVADMGGKLDPEVIGRHKNNHWVKPARTDGPQSTKRDLAILVRDRVMNAIESMPEDGDRIFVDVEDEEGNPRGIQIVKGDPILNKDFAPIIGKGLQAQALLDKRDQAKAKNALQAGAMTLVAALAGLGRAAPPPELDDGTTIDGVAVEVPE